MKPTSPSKSPNGSSKEQTYKCNSAHPPKIGLRFNKCKEDIYICPNEKGGDISICRLCHPGAKDINKGIIPFFIFSDCRPSLEKAAEVKIYEMRRATRGLGTTSAIDSNNGIVIEDGRLHFFSPIDVTLLFTPPMMCSKGQFSRLPDLLSTFTQRLKRDNTHIYNSYLSLASASLREKLKHICRTYTMSVEEGLTNGEEMGEGEVFYRFDEQMYCEYIKQKIDLGVWEMVKQKIVLLECSTSIFDSSVSPLLPPRKSQKVGVEDMGGAGADDFVNDDSTSPATSQVSHHLRVETEYARHLLWDLLYVYVPPSLRDRVLSHLNLPPSPDKDPGPKRTGGELPPPPTLLKPSREKGKAKGAPAIRKADKINNKKNNTPLIQQFLKKK